jgi:NAD(P)-dependent dehydrogenase (short-subunit alcohol dehydrogenase family)
VQKALPLLNKGSSVILTGAIVSIKGFASCSVYNASKAAVHSFAWTWIVDLKGRDIRVNVLSPGYTDTPGLSDFVRTISWRPITRVSCAGRLPPSADRFDRATASCPCERLTTATKL